MDRSCDVCGTSYVAKRTTSRYCSAKCRMRASRGTSAKPTAPEPQEMVLERSAGPVEWATALELREIGRLETALGLQCLALARRLDAPLRDTGSAMASISRELRATLAEAKRGAGAATSPQQLRDELAERRVRHGA
jgi:hypothetical protein